MDDALADLLARNVLARCDLPTRGDVLVCGDLLARVPAACASESVSECADCARAHVPLSQRRLCTAVACARASSALGNACTCAHALLKRSRTCAAACVLKSSASNSDSECARIPLRCAAPLLACTLLPVEPSPFPLCAATLPACDSSRFELSACCSAAAAYKGTSHAMALVAAV